MPRRSTSKEEPRAISGRTRIVGIFGDPVEHSRSPAMHNAAFSALSLDWIYLPFHVQPTDLRSAVQSIRALGLAGVNLTVPHKVAAVPLVDSISPNAERIGAINTIIRRGAQLHGENTDVVGLLRSLRTARVQVRNRTVVVIGAGGAARSAVVALSGAGARRIWLANRTVARARRLASQLGSPETHIESVSLRSLTDERLLREATLVLNTTSIGWGGERFPALRYDRTSAGCIFHDMVYGRPTDFLRRASAAGRRTVDGSEMLIQQGACSFTLWTRRRAPVDRMRQVLALPKLSLPKISN